MVPAGVVVPDGVAGFAATVAVPAGVAGAPGAAGGVPVTGVVCVEREAFSLASLITLSDSSLDFSYCLLASWVSDSIFSVFKRLFSKALINSSCLSLSSSRCSFLKLLNNSK